MHPTFRNDFTIEVREFFKKPHILQQLRAAHSGRYNVLVVRYRSTKSGREFLSLVGHVPSFTGNQVSAQINFADETVVGLFEACLKRRPGAKTERRPTSDYRHATAKMAPTFSLVPEPTLLILGIIVFGMLVGWLAQLVLRVDLGDSKRPNAQSLIAGLAGSFVGGLLSSLIAGDGIALRPSGLIGSFVGAVIVVAIWTALARRKAN